MHRYKVKVCVNDGHTKRNLLTHIDAESEEDARKAIMSCADIQSFISAEITEMEEM